MPTLINPASHAIERQRQTAATADYVVTGFKPHASLTTLLYCDSEADCLRLIELLFNCGFTAANWQPNPKA